MRATPFNVCAILSLFSVAIHAAPHDSLFPLECLTSSSGNGSVRPDCTLDPTPYPTPAIPLPLCPTSTTTGRGPGPRCNPGPGTGPEPTSTGASPSLPECPTSSNNFGPVGPQCNPSPGPTATSYLPTDILPNTDLPLYSSIPSSS